MGNCHCSNGYPRIYNLFIVPSPTHSPTPLRSHRGVMSLSVVQAVCIVAVTAVLWRLFGTYVVKSSLSKLPGPPRSSFWIGVLSFSVGHMTYRCVIHIFRSHRKNCREREDDTDKECPQYASCVAKQSQYTITKIERPWFEHYLWMRGKYPSTEDRNDVAQVQCHGGQRKNCVCSHRTRKV